MKLLRKILFLSCINGVFRFWDPEPLHPDEIDEAAATAQGHPGRELLNESFMFREPEQLTEECRVQEAAQLNTRPKQEVEGSPERENLRIAYRKYIQTRQRTATIKEQLWIDNLLWFTAIPASFWEPHTGVAGALDDLKMLQGLIDGQRVNVLHLDEVWASTRT